MFKKIIFLTLCFVQGLHALDAQNFLTNEQIALAKVQIEKELIKKEYVSNSGHAIGTAALAIILYKYGAFDYVLGKIKAPPSGVAVSVAPVFVSVADFQAFKDEFKALKERVLGNNGWLEFGKSVFWTGAQLIASQALVSKLQIMHWLTKPDYEWIFKDKTHILRLADDALFNAGRYARCLVAEPLKADHYKDELKVIMAKMHTDIEYLIAYLEYRVERMDPQDAVACNMDSMPRFIFNLYNDFVKECDAALIVDNGPAVLAAVKDLRGDLANCYDHCILLV